MAAGTFVAFSNNSATAANLAATKPTGTVDDDFLIALVINYIGGGGDINSVPAGWAELTNNTWRGAGLDSRARLYTKTAAGEGASWTWGNNTSGGAPMRIYVTTWRSLALGAPSVAIDVLSTRSAITGAQPIAGTSVIPAHDYALIVAFGVIRGALASSNAPGLPAGYSSAFAIGDSGFASGFGCAYLGQSAAAASGALEFTQSGGGNSDRSIIHTLGLSPRPTPRSLAVMT